MRSRLPAIALLALLAACGGKGGADDTAPAGGDDTSADTGDDTGQDTGDDTGSTGRTGRTGRTGTATAGPGLGYSGSEEWWFVGEDGEDLCRVRTALESVAEREDCGDCAWAFDLVRTGVEVVSGDLCGDLVGQDVLDGLEGSTVSYGYAPEYFGHAEVLMEDDGSGWTATAFATWDEATGLFEYQREDGYFEY